MISRAAHSSAGGGGWVALVPRARVRVFTESEGSRRRGRKEMATVTTASGATLSSMKVEVPGMVEHPSTPKRAWTIDEAEKLYGVASGATATSA